MELNFDRGGGGGGGGGGHWLGGLKVFCRLATNSIQFKTPEKGNVF